MPPRAAKVAALVVTGLSLTGVAVWLLRGRGVALPSLGAKSMVDLALPHVGERYVYGSVVPYNDPNYRGPWDCAEFISWLAYQSTGRLYGAMATTNGANAYTGTWQRDVQNSTVQSVSVDTAIRTRGAILLRYPGSGVDGHIALSLGNGQTVEAQSTATGVVIGKATGRSWSVGVIIPGTVSAAGSLLA